MEVSKCAVDVARPRRRFDRAASWVATSRPGGNIPAALAAATLLEFAYLWLRPQAPDLPAQLARASAASHGAELWWAGWYGGINTSTYSLVSADLMSALGVGAVGVLATAAICLFGADLVRSCARPQAGALAISVTACANLYSGRITFAAGMAVALASFCLLRRGRVTPALGLSLMTGFVSPLAALCQLIGLGALVVSGQGRRRVLIALMAACGLPVALVSVVFGQPSYMPFSVDVCVFALLACAGVGLAPVPRTVRAMAVLSALLAVGAIAVHSPVGSNAARMPMLAAAPLVIATARRGTAYISVLAAGLVIWPLVSFSGDMVIAGQPSSHAAFYRPLLEQLPPAGQSLQRVEVLDPVTHGAAFYLSTQVPLARGWERQIDAASNPIFYDDELSADSYRRWLVAHAVGWVAVPAAKLDYSAVPEKVLVTGGLPYLRLTWSNANWQLYRFTRAAPVATGVLHATALTDTSMHLIARAAGEAAIRVPYSRLLTLRSTVDPTVTGCVSRAPTGDVVATVPSAGPYLLEAEISSLTGTCPNRQPHVSTPPAARKPIPRSRPLWWGILGDIGLS